MPIDTDEIIEKDEDLKTTESRIIELRKKTDRTPDEEQEFVELKKHHRGRVEEQILSERERAQTASDRAAKAEQALEDARARLKEIEDSKQNQPSDGAGNENETVFINGKKFFSDDAIILRVQKGLMSQKEGWAMQRALIKEEAKADLKGEEPLNEANRIRKESLEYVKSKGYGWMIDEKDPKHNPNDPLFKTANRLWSNGYKNDPDGPRKSLDDALDFLGRNIREDRSDDFGVPKNNSAATSSSVKQNKIELTDIESTNAVRYWPTVTNPKTGKYYTEAEALVKALEAKRKRMSK